MSDNTRRPGDDPLEPFPVQSTKKPSYDVYDADSSSQPRQQGSRASQASRSSSGARKPATGKSGGSGGTPPRKPRKSGGGGSGANPWRSVIITVTGVLATSFILAFLGISIFSDLFGLNKPDQQVEVTIAEGSTDSQIRSQLKRLGIIQYPSIFGIYSGLGSSGNVPFQPGTYIFNTNMSYDELLIALRNRSSTADTVRITFYEGMTQREIAALLEDEGVCSASAFNAYLETANFDFEFLNMVPEDDLRFRRLEGYLFPDTYEFFIGEAVSNVAYKFLSRFDQMITDEVYDMMRERNLTLDETITLASIIQKECSVAEEANTVSSVFHNRLSNTATYPKLQSDVTIFYVNRDIKPFLDVQNQAMYDAYNTYECEGLSIGPICNPGMQSIMAALQPENTEYYFFITDADEEFYYATTYQEHLRNIQLAGSGASGIDTGSN